MLTSGMLFKDLEGCEIQITRIDPGNIVAWPENVDVEWHVTRSDGLKFLMPAGNIHEIEQMISDGSLILVERKKK